MNDARSTLSRFQDLDFEIGTYVHATARLQLSSRMHHRFITVITERLQKKQLSRRAGITSAEQARMKDARCVQDDRVVSRNQAGEITKFHMFDRPRLTTHDHQPAFIAPLGRNLRYLIGREMKIVVIGSASVSNQNREGCEPLDGIVKPKCLYACAVAMRPREVR